MGSGRGVAVAIGAAVALAVGFTTVVAVALPVAVPARDVQATRQIANTLTSPMIVRRYRECIQSGGIHNSPEIYKFSLQIRTLERVVLLHLHEVDIIYN